jgi:CRP-like cAMP-binding protein
MIFFKVFILKYMKDSDQDVLEK